MDPTVKRSALESITVLKAQLKHAKDATAYTGQVLREMTSGRLRYAAGLAQAAFRLILGPERVPHTPPRVHLRDCPQEGICAPGCSESRAALSELDSSLP